MEDETLVGPPQNPGGTNPPAMLKEEPEEVVEEPVEGHNDTPYQSVEKVAQEVVQGRWGIGQARRAALKKAGYDPNEVNEEVKKILNRR